MENILSFIKKCRKEKGYSYETMGFELNISPAAYRKIETHQTKLTVERLFQIVKVLGVTLETILGIEENKMINHVNPLTDFTLGNSINFHSEYKEKTAKIESLYEERIKEQAITINQLIEVINKR